MDGYGLVLFLHLCALLGAIGTATLLHFAEAERRRCRATTEAPGRPLAAAGSRAR
jgi:hypothetical protein